MNNNLYEHGTLAMLMAGKLSGTITLAELLKHGEHGIGTLDGLDGEVIILDNEVYQADETGTVNRITDMDATLPFASVHHAMNETTLTLPKADFNILNDTIVKEHNFKNVFVATRFHGVFEAVKVRVAPKQTRPYPGLLEIASNQPIFEKQNVSGTVIGYFAPELFGTVTAGGWHLHFLSDDRQFGGHLLDFVGTNLTGTYQIFDSLEQHFPVSDPEFRAYDIDLASLQADIQAAEGN
ncbi:acetolactate decarboxylase [Periweissella beninensis]|uniref:acetolactate decarboxylase n=1 Tax=Periweissella beninensis TaxID=504936 RepID=UPI0021A92A9C|nr:acetolactate decarboxylase [Periweissella beninensis]MCT4396015.1 acetolactate decarboxylase [Periweissella beninensis]